MGHFSVKIMRLPGQLSVEINNENAKLKRLLADTMLDNVALKDLLAKNW